MKMQVKLTVALITLTALTIILTACNSELSRSKAETLIKEKYNNMPADRIFIPAKVIIYDSWKNRPGFIGLSEMEKCYKGQKENAFYKDNAIKQAVTDGFLSVTVLGYTKQRDLLCQIDLTEKIKPYFITKHDYQYQGSEYAIAATYRRIINVTGITKRDSSNGQNISIATYTYEFENSPIGVIFSGQQTRDNQQFNGSEVFVLFDDGWRIQ